MSLALILSGGEVSIRQASFFRNHFEQFTGEWVPIVSATRSRDFFSWRAMVQPGGDGDVIAAK